jgi:hypothetical protein
MTTAKPEPPIPMEQLNLEPFSEEERLRLRELMLEEAFMDASDGKPWRGHQGLWKRDRRQE